ncbi:MAG: hypothetical protein RL701_328, partial [Pseudomonadota bacterium]
MLTNPSARRVLFVDGDVGLAQSFSKLGRAWGYQVDIAANGGRALELADRTEYAVVLTETTLSDMTGAALIESLS